jgi:hypothetical protein
MLKKDYPLGVKVYEGPSLIDGKPIVVLITGFADGGNEKTGDMLQAWIMRQDIPPIKAKTDYKDFSVCGDCKHRESKSCYVHLLHGPTPVYNAYLRGRYIRYTTKCEKFFAGKSLRIGAYGDPAAVPTAVWHRLSLLVDRYTGYTHQWKRCDQKLQNYCMASVDSIGTYIKEYKQAADKGWRTFRTRCFNSDPILENEIICPASKEAGKITVCNHCNACSGSISNRKNPVIAVHGVHNKIINYIKMMKRIAGKKKWQNLNNPPKSSMFKGLAYYKKGYIGNKYFSITLVKKAKTNKEENDILLENLLIGC